MNDVPQIEADALKHQLDEGPLILIDVRLADDYAAGHLPGAVNNCVFEVAFLERMPEITENKSALLCVYGAGVESHESRMAVEKLVRAGYENVSEFRDGLAGWKAADFPLEGDGTDLGSPDTPDGELPIDLEESRVEWTGRNLLNKHWGRIGLKSGSLTFDNGQLTGGECVIDLTAITCDDLADSPAHDVLIHHLESDDFFDVEQFPEGRIEITGAKPIDGAMEGAPNFLVSANLTLKGITEPIEFPIAAGITPEGKAAAQASFSIDRTRWNVLYGSGKFFARLAGHLVNDEIDLQLRIVTQ